MDLFSKNVKQTMIDNSHLLDCDFTYSDKLLYEASVGYENSDVRKQKKRAARRTTRNATKARSAKIHTAPDPESQHEPPPAEEDSESEHEEEDESGHSIGHLRRTAGLVVSS